MEQFKLNNGMEAEKDKQDMEYNILVKDKILVKLPTDDRILETLHSQFAENQNHHQKIFIQLLIALFAIFGVYGYVYTHIQLSTDITCQITSLGKQDNIEFYSINTLMMTSFIVIAALTLLNAIILNMGYGFRRDQHLNKKIREKYLGDEVYDEIFGELYNSDNKCLCNFLPNFYSTFFVFITISQIFVFFTTLFKHCIQCSNNTAVLLLVFSGILILCSLCMYCRKYCKYESQIKNQCDNKNKNNNK